MADEGVPGGYGAVGRRGGGGRVVEPVVAPTYGTSGGYYTDASGRQISQAEAQALGRVDAPGAAAEKLRAIGGGATTTQIEQRMGIEEARKRGEITRQEAITLTQQNIEGRPLQIFRQVEQERQKRADVVALQEFRARTDRLSPVGRGYREATQREITQLAPERVYVNIGGKRVPFVSRSQAEQQRPTAKIEQAIYDKNVELSNVLKYDVPAKIPKPIINFFDTIDKRAELSFQSKKPLNPFALRNVAEAFYNIEKGMVKGVVEQPLTAGASLLLGGALTKGAGVLAARVPLLTKGVSAGRVGSKISALNIAGGAMAGYYGADVAKRIAASNKRNETMGKILSTEIIPFVAGARLAQIPIVSTAKNANAQFQKAINSQRKDMRKFLKSEAATSYFGGERKAIPTKRIETPFASKMDIEVKTAAIRRASFRTPSMVQSPKISRQVSRQTLETPAQEYMKKIDVVSEVKANALADALYEATTEQGVRAGGKGYVSSARLKEARSIDDIMIKIAKKQKQLSRIKQQESVSLSPGRSVYVQRPIQSSIQLQKQANKTAQISRTLLASIQKTELKQVAQLKSLQIPQQKYKQVPVVISAAISAQKAIQKEKAITKQVSQQKYVSVAVSVQKQKTKQVQIVKNIFAQAQDPASVQKPKLKTPQVPEIKVPVRPKVPQIPIKIKVPPKQPPTRITKEPPFRPPTTKPPRRPPKKIIILDPPTFDTQLGEIIKARKKRGKFVWNIRNQIPTLESLIG